MKCPQCGFETVKKEEAEIPDWLGYLIFFGILIIGFILFGWFIITMAEWFTEYKTLREILRQQWEWLKHLRF